MAELRAEWIKQLPSSHILRDSGGKAAWLSLAVHSFHIVMPTKSAMDIVLEHYRFSAQRSPCSTTTHMYVRLFFSKMSQLFRFLLEWHKYWQRQVHAWVEEKAWRCCVGSEWLVKKSTKG